MNGIRLTGKVEESSSEVACVLVASDSCGGCGGCCGGGGLVASVFFWMGVHRLLKFRPWVQGVAGW